MINQESRTSIFYQVTFIMGMPWQVDKNRSVDYQKSLLDRGLDFAQTQLQEKRYILRRQQNSPLQVLLDAPGPNLTGLQITSANPTVELSVFIEEATAATEAFRKTFPAKQYQVVRSAARIQHLYSCSEHAFQYIWEKRLAQSPADLALLGQRPVAGGGFRIVMPPQEKPDEEPCSIELRIESWMREPNKLLTDTAFVWPKPTRIQGDESFSPAGRCRAVERFACNEVLDFLAASST